MNKRKRQSCMGKQCAWIWERPNTYLCTGTSSRRLAVRFLELQFFCWYVRSRRFASRPVTPATRVTLPYTQNPVTLEEDFAWSTYLLTNPAPAGCTQSAWYDKKESVSLVWAIREAVCGDWERPLPNPELVARLPRAVGFGEARQQVVLHLQRRDRDVALRHVFRHRLRREKKCQSLKKQTVGGIR